MRPYESTWAFARTVDRWRVIRSGGSRRWFGVPPVTSRGPGWRRTG